MVLVLPAAVAAVQGPSLGVATPVDDCGSGHDSAWNWPARFEAPGVCDAWIGAPDVTSDHLAFAVDRPAVIRMTAHSSGAVGYYACLTGASIARACAGPGWVGYPGQTAATATTLSPGEFQIEVTQLVPEGRAGQYRIAIELLPVPSHEDCGSGSDVGGWGAPFHLALPADCAGHLDSSYDSADAFTFDVPDVEWLTLEAWRPIWREVCLWRPDGSYHGCTAVGGGAHIRDPMAGRWKVVMRAYYETYDYRLRIHVSDLSPYDDCGSGLDAERMPLAGSCAGKLLGAYNDHSDSFTIALDAGEVVSASVTGDANVTLCLTRPSGARVACGGYGTGDARSLRYWADEPGEWLLSVGAYRFHEMPYVVAASVAPGVPVAQDDCGSGRDAAADDAVLVTASPCAGAFPAVSGDVLDVFALDAPEGAIVRARLAVAEGDARLCLHAPDGSLRTCAAPSESADDFVLGPAEMAGRYTARVALADGAPSYTLHLSAALEEDDCGGGRDAAGTRARATRIAGGACEARMLANSLDRADWYALDARAGQTLALAWASPSGTLSGELCLFAPGATVAAACTTGAPLTRVLDADGAWALQMRRVSGGGAYALSANLA